MGVSDEEGPGRVDAPLGPGVARYLERLRVERGALEEAIAAATGRGSAALVGRLLVAMTDDGLSTDERRLEEIGRECADAGLSNESISVALVAATRNVCDWAMQRAAAEGDIESCRAFCQHATSFFVAITGPLVAAHTARLEARTTPWDERSRFWSIVLEGGFSAEEDAIAYGRRVGCDPHVPWMLVVVPAPHDSDVLEADLRAVLPDAVAVPLTTGGLQHVAFAAPGPAQARLAAIACEHRATLLTVGPVAGTRQFQRGCRTALPLVPHIAAIANGPGVVRSEALADAALLTTIPRPAALEFARDVLAPIRDLPAGTRESFLRTIEAFVSNDGAKAAALALNVHEKTVRRRAERLKDELGLDVNNFETRHQLRLAVVLAKLFSDSNRFQD